MPRRISSLSTKHLSLCKRVDEFTFSQIEEIMRSDYSDCAKMSFIVSTTEKRVEAMEELDAMFEEAQSGSSISF